MSEDSLHSKVSEWFKTQGYGLEMLVASKLSNCGFDVIQSYFYDDPETGKSREADVVGRMADKVGLLNVYSVIECKKSSRPWILLSSKVSSYNRLHAFAIMSDSAKQAVLEHSHCMVESQWFKKDDRVAYNITEAFTNKEDETFRGGMAATNAAIALLRKQESITNRSFMNFVFPTIVFDGRLFEAYLDDEGEVKIDEIDSGYIMFSVKINSDSGSSIRIVTLKALDRYCQEVNETFRHLKTCLSDSLVNLADSIGLTEEKLNAINYFQST